LILNEIIRWLKINQFKQKSAYLAPFERFSHFTPRVIHSFCGKSGCFCMV